MSFKTAAFFLFKDKDLIIWDELFLSSALLLPPARKTSQMKQYVVDVNQRGKLRAGRGEWARLQRPTKNKGAEVYVDGRKS